MDERPIRIDDVTENPLAEKFARMISVQLHACNWERAHALIEQYRLESRQFRKPLTRAEWIQEPLCNIPGLSVRLVNTIETHFGIIFLEQFLKRIPNEAVLLEADNIGPIQAAQLRDSLSAIGIIWPRVFRNTSDVDFAKPDHEADQLLQRARDSPGG